MFPEAMKTSQSQLPDQLNEGRKWGNSEDEVSLIFQNIIQINKQLDLKQP